MKNRLTLKLRCNWFVLANLFTCFSGSVATAAVVRNECASPPPGTVFCEDFEGANPKANFDDFDGNSDTENLIVVDAGPAAVATNKAIRLRVAANQSGTSDLIKVLPTFHDKLFARWYLKYEPGFNFAAGNHGSGLGAGDRNLVGRSGNRPTGADFAGFHVQYQENTRKPYTYSYYRGMYQQCISAGNCFGDAFPCVYDTGASYCTKPQDRPAVTLPTFTAGQWYCVEQMVDMGTATASAAGANGRLTLWMDGQQLGDFPGLWIRTTAELKLQTLWLALFHHDGTHSDVGELIDNVVVSTQRVGCGGVAPPLSVVAVQSRKTHGSAGAFDIAIDTVQPITGAVTVEPRRIGTGHTIVFQFDAAITATGTASSSLGSATAAIAGNDVLVTLTGIPDKSRATVSLTNVNNAGVNASASMGFLIGDVNSTRSVDPSDISEVKKRSGQGASAANSRFDLNATGAVNSSDIAAVKARSGFVLP